MSKDYKSPIEMWREEKKKRQEAEGELTIIKGIGNNSPEMKALEKRIKELENSLSIALEINDNYQRELKEVKEDNKKLTLQINNLEKYKNEH
jgi:chromosome segregation ATPase|tara:strand:+ start:963 stop:1238 length:276 start_codon:yes stop_codon:yes gene_type:complete